MKNAILCGIAAISTFLFSCSNSETKSNTNAHTHEDGSVHADHAPDTAKPIQQEFSVADTMQAQPSNNEHTHSDGHTHSH